MRSAHCCAVGKSRTCHWARPAHRRERSQDRIPLWTGSRIRRPQNASCAKIRSRFVLLSMHGTSFTCTSVLRCLRWRLQFFNRRHHCRACGQIVCSDCSYAALASRSPHGMCSGSTARATQEEQGAHSRVRQGVSTAARVPDVLHRTAQSTGPAHPHSVPCSIVPACFEDSAIGTAFCLKLKQHVIGAWRMLPVAAHASDTAGRSQGCE